MKKLFTVSTLTLISVFMLNAAIAGTPWLDKKLDKKEQQQKARIMQGVKSGELTPWETRRMVKGQRQLHAMERRAKADGVVTAKERMRLNSKSQIESAKIYRYKHNKQKRAKAM